MLRLLKCYQEDKNVDARPCVISVIEAETIETS